MMKMGKRLLAAMLIVLMLVTSAPVGVVQAKTTKIPTDAVQFGGHYYKLYPGGTTESWEEAKKYCESLGGYLAVISSEKENTFLYNYILSQETKDAYFGVTDSGEEGTWKWVSNEKSTYTNWASGEPNNEFGNENYGMYFWKFDDGSWNDANFINGPFICEWNPNSTISSISAPTGLKVTATNTTAMNLTWNKVSGATGYVVYQYNASTKKYTKIGATTKNSYKITGLKQRTTYQFAVKAYKNGYYSDYSNLLKATTAKGVFRVFIDRSTYSYYEGESFCICAGIEVNGKFIKPTNLKVTSSSSSIISASKVYDISGMNPSTKIQTKSMNREKFGSLKKQTVKKDTILTNTNICVLQALKPGNVSITVTCDEAKKPIQFHVSVLKDTLKEFRANTFQSTYFKDADSCYATNGGLFIKNFKCEKNNSSYKVTMDVWNRLACYGALEVYNSKGKLIAVEMINKWEGLPTSIKETAIAYWHLVSDFTTKGSNTDEWDLLSEKTHLVFKVPKDGYFKITNDSAQSQCCYMYNMMDLYLASFFLTKDVIDTVDPTPEMKQDKKATEDLIKKSVKSFILKETKQNVVKKYMTILSKDIGTEFALSMASDYLGMITGVADEFFKKIDIQPIDLLKAASTTTTAITESCFTQWLEVGAPAMTKAVKLALNINSGINIIYLIKAFLFDTYNKKNITLLLYAPANAKLSAPTGLKSTAINTTALKLKWNPVSGATGYVVYRYNPSTKKYTQLGETDKTVFKVKKLKPGTTYSFAVRAYKATGSKDIYSSYSSIIKVTTMKA